MNIVIGILAALLSFGFIVCIHELGHFLAARWAGIRCPYFAIGFGPKLFGFEWRGTEFSLRLLPLGGYVWMEGEEAPGGTEPSWHQTFTQAVGDVQFPVTPAQVLAEMPEPRDAEVETFLRSLPPGRVYHHMGDLEGNFRAKSTLHKTVVLLAGVTMNFICAVVLMLGLGFTVGLGMVMPNLQPRAQNVIAESPAARAGLQSGDTLLAVNGSGVVSGEDFKDLMRDTAGQPVRVKVKGSDGQERTLQLVPDLVLDGGYYFTQSQGKLQLVRADRVELPAGLTLPWTVEKVNGDGLRDLGQLQSLARHSKQLELTGGNQSLLLKDSGSGIGARGVAGIELVQVMSLEFESLATNEVISVLPGSQAEKAGLQAGDLVVMLAGLDVRGQTTIDHSLKQLSQRPLKDGQVLALTILRQGKRVDLKLDTPPASNSEAFGLRFRPITASVVVKSVASDLGTIVRLPEFLLRGFLSNFRATLTDLKKNSTGPIGIMQQIFEVSDEGLPHLLFLLGLLNAFIAIFNLLPIPALDGSRILFVWLGALRGRALNPDKEDRIHFVGIVLLLSVALLVSIQDMHRVWQGMPLMK
jgi:regulator of sigma E protease